MPKFTEFYEKQGERSKAEIAKEAEEAAAALGQQVTELTDKIKEERFLFTLVLVILLDIMFLADSPNGLLSLGIIFLEFCGLVILAKRLQIEEAGQVLDKMWSGVTKIGGNHID